MNTPLNKRFWKDVSVRRDGDGYAVLLDTRPLKTPAKAAFVVPSKPLAEAIAQEWDGVEKTIEPRTMHLTRCANATIDKVSLEKQAVADMLAEYGGTDLLCYRATTPAELARRQAAQWDPVLDWLRATFGVDLRTTAGVMHVPQPVEATTKLRDLVRALDPWRLTAFHDLVTLSGSLVLAFSIIEEHLDAEQAWEISRVDEQWQEEQWGIDDDAARDAQLKRDEFLKAKMLFDLLTQ